MRAGARADHEEECVLDLAMQPDDAGQPAEHFALSGDHLTLVGHSNGGDISMFFAQQHPEMVRRVVTLDNLRVPFVTSGFAKILSFRSKDPQFKTDPGVLPDAKTAKEAGIEIIDTGAQHTELSDRGPDSVKARIQSTLDKFLSDEGSSKLQPLDVQKDIKRMYNDPRAMGP
jgi:pimeloyl-ACP methyl ester carboxylesterase